MFRSKLLYVCASICLYMSVCVIFHFLSKSCLIIIYAYINSFFAKVYRESPKGNFFENIVKLYSFIINTLLISLFLLPSLMLLQLLLMLLFCTTSNECRSICCDTVAHFGFLHKLKIDYENNKKKINHCSALNGRNSNTHSKWYSAVLLENLFSLEIFLSKV